MAKHQTGKQAIVWINDCLLYWRRSLDEFYQKNWLNMMHLDDGVNFSTEYDVLKHRVCANFPVDKHRKLN